LRNAATASWDSQRSKMSMRPGSIRSAVIAKQAAVCLACPFDDAHTAREVGLALFRVDRDVSCDDDHGFAPHLELSDDEGVNPCA